MDLCDHIDMTPPDRHSVLDFCFYSIVLSSFLLIFFSSGDIIVPETLGINSYAVRKFGNSSPKQKCQTHFIADGFGQTKNNLI